MIESVGSVLGAGTLLLGLVLASIGLFGMFRKRAIFEQLHAAGLVTGPAAILVLLASLASARAEIATSGFLVLAFVLVTSSLSTHAIALAAWRQGTGSTRTRAGSDADDQPGAGSAGLARTAMRVLIAHDGSPGADVGVALTASLPLPAGSVIRLIAAIEGDLAPLSASEPTSDPPAPAMVDLRVPLEAAARRLQRPGVTIDHVVRRGDPSMVIAAEAETLGADLVVVGSRGLGRIRTLLVGSVAAAVVDTSPCPVLVARIPRMSKVLLATDGSVPSAVATDRLAHWPIFEDVPILVLSVATSVPQYGDPPSGSGMQEIVQTARQQKVVDAAAVPLLEAGRRVIPRVRTGDAAAQIVSYGHGQSVDLIVVGSRGRTGLTRTLLGSVARGVLASARTSVLIVRPMPSSREDPAMRFTSQ